MNLVNKGGFSKLIVRTGPIFRSQIPDRHLDKNFSSANLVFEEDGQVYEISLAFFFKLDVLDKEGFNHSYCFFENNFSINFNSSFKNKASKLAFSGQSLPDQWLLAKKTCVDPKLVEKWIGQTITIREDITISVNEFDGDKGEPITILVYYPEPGKCPVSPFFLFLFFLIILMTINSFFPKFS